MINNVPKVSVVVPVYNVEKYLLQCLDSICNQTLKDIEIICVNDGSTDSSLEIIKKCAKADNRIRVITGENEGYGAAVNKGFAVAKGEYISLIESDDFILSNMYEVMYDICERNHHILDFIKGNTIKFYGDGGEDDCTVIPVISNKNLYNTIIEPLDKPEVFNAYMVNTTGLYKTSFIKENNIILNESKGASFQDNGLWFQLFMHARRIMFINQAFYMYRMDRADSSTNCMSYDKAFCIFNEWKYIYNLLCKVDIEIKNKYLPVFILRCFGSLFYHFTRILDDYKIMYLRHFAEYMNHLKSIGDLDISFLLPYQEKNLISIMEDPIAYFYSSSAERVNNLFEKKLQNKLTELNNAIVSLRNLEQENQRRKQNQKNIKISVIIPVYNAQEQLQKCLSSVRKQTLKNIEIVCVDDGSTDNSMSILLLNMTIDNRIVVFKQNNQGAGLARNKGLELAKGEFVAFMDSDDYYPDDITLEKLYKTAQDNKVSICGGNFSTIEEGRIKFENTNAFQENKCIKYEDFQEDYGYQAYIYNLKMLQDNSICFPEYRRFQDPPFFIRAMVCAKKFYAIKDVTYIYRFVPSHVKWNEEKIADLIKGIIDCIEISKNNELAKLHYKAVMRLEVSYASRILEHYNNNLDIIRLLILAEQKIDIGLFNQGAEKNKFQEKIRLNIVNKVLSNEELIESRRNNAEYKRKLDKAFEEQNQKKLEYEREIDIQRGMVNHIKNSLSYRIGMAFTFIPRMMRRVICRLVKKSNFFGN